MNVIIPQITLDAFPILSNAKYDARIAPLFAPDTTFDIFALKSGERLALVTTDYADPLDQSRELKKGSNKYEFINLLRPYSGSSETIEILEHDDMEGDFLVRAGKFDTYVARLRSV